MQRTPLKLQNGQQGAETKDKQSRYSIPTVLPAAEQVLENALMAASVLLPQSWEIWA